MKALVSTLIAFAMLMLCVGAVVAQSGHDLFQQALVKERTEGDIPAAVVLYQTIVQKHGSDRALVAKALVQMGQCYEKLGQREGLKIYERVVREFADQTESAAAARARLAALQSPAVAQVGQTVRLVWNNLASMGLNSPSFGPLSTDGRYLSCTCGPTGLAILDLKTSKFLSLGPRTNLGVDEGWSEASVVSPDGRQVAYVWVKPEPGVGSDGQIEDLRVVQVDGGSAKSRSVHLNNYGYVGEISWSPDGKSVVVVREVGEGLASTAQMAVISIADGAVRVIKANPAGGRRPTFSPDGRYVAYYGPDTAPDIFVLAADGSGRETRIVEAPGSDLSPMWSPDGSHIVFLSDRTGTMSLWTVPVSEGTPTGPARLLKDNVGRFEPVGLTRSGSLYYVAGNAVTNVYTAELDAKLSATAALSMATNQFINSNRDGVWSADGQYLAYRAASQRGVVIRIRSVKTGADREVPSLIQSSGPVRWFPDGQSLLVASRDLRLLDGQLGYYRVNIASGHAELLHQTASKDLVSTRPDLSPDGKTIFYLETPGQPMRVDIASRRETKLTPVGNPAGRETQPLSLAVSPDGAQVAYVGPSSLVVAPAAGGQPREVISLSGNSYPRERAEGYGVAWSADQRYLFFARAGKPFRSAIWRVPITGGEAENIGVSMDSSSGAVTRIRALRMHADGRRIAFDWTIDPPFELWVLENFLPGR